jgi:hypothetical protein
MKIKKSEWDDGIVRKLSVRELERAIDSGLFEKRKG